MPLQQAKRITCLNAAGCDDVGIYAGAWKLSEVSEIQCVQARDSLQDGRIRSQLAAGQRRYNAARTWDGHANDHFGSDRNGAADPGIFRKTGRALRVYDNVRPKA